MTTPTEPNGMVYPLTAIIVVAMDTDTARQELRQYGIDLEASATYISVVTSSAEIQALTVDQRRWASAGDVAYTFRHMMTVRFGEAITMAALVAVANQNVVLRRQRGGTP